MVLAISYAGAGQHTEATALLTPLIDAARQSPNESMAVAAVFAELRDIEQTIAWLEEAYRNHDLNLRIMNVGPVFDAVRADPRFQDLVHRIGIPSA